MMAAAARDGAHLSRRDSPSSMWHNTTDSPAGKQHVEWAWSSNNDQGKDMECVRYDMSQSVSLHTTTLLTMLTVAAVSQHSPQKPPN